MNWAGCSILNACRFSALGFFGFILCCCSVLNGPQRFHS